MAERELTQTEIDAKVAVQQALARKLAAEALKAEYDADRARCVYEDAELDLLKAKIAWDKEQEKRQEELLDDKHQHVYQFSSQVDAGNVKSCMAQLTLWHRKDPGCEITIVFHSPGGSVIEGMALFDHILWLRSEGHYVTTIAMGYAASMAGILLQAGDKRMMGREAYLLVHEISFGAGGKIGEVEDEVEFAKKITKRVLGIFAQRTHMTAAQIDKKWQRKDWWLDSDEALQLGFVDEVA